jgi:phosphomannomutase
MRDKIGDASPALKLLVDCGNGTAVKTVPQLLEKMGFNVTTLFGEIDGRMPNRPSELTATGLQQASAGMAGHDLGIAFDGDADRVAFIAPDGEMIDLERFAVVFLKALTEIRHGPIVANVSCGQTIASLAQRFGCEFYRVPTGAPHMINKAMEVDAIFGMESSGHLIIPSVMPNDDAVAVAAFAATALSQLVRNGYSLRKLLDSVPTYYRAMKVLAVADGEKEILMQKLANYFQTNGIEVDTLDGLRIVSPTGWVLFRASGTEPALRLFAEADSKAESEQMIAEGMQLINKLHG